MDRARRRWCSAFAVALAAPRIALAREPLRIGVTAVILDDQVSFLEEWRQYLGRKLGREVRFVQRGSYRGINDLLRDGKIDFAWVCGAPYVRHAAFMKLLAVPVYQGRPLYRSYLIVPSDDGATRSLLDLRGRVFAYSDPESNSGYLYVQSALLALHERPKAFFGRTFFTWTHRNVVEAVRSRLAHGGTVDGYVWDTLAKLHPEIARGTRVVAQSPDFGFPPFVAHRDVPAAEFETMRAVLVGMAEDAAGARLLARLNLDGFIPGEPALFAGIARMAREVDGG
ncbi:MAG TPA: PhnD/SsuA/transferrin family substrate-binding protein [Usitatibacter sp.]|nr:PhnD/SsuA/transferrin family substrate-binding protein [Usitatibacter sp.]